MKKFVILFALIVSAQALANHEIRVPRSIGPAISVSNQAAIKTYISALIEESEGLTLSQGLVIYTDTDGEDLCVVKGSGLTCQLSYLNDRWNGTLSAEFELSKDGSKIVKLTRVDLDGSF